MQRILLSALSLAFTASSAFAAAPTPAAFGQAFCEASHDGDMSLIESALSPSLSIVVVDAWAKNDALQASAPDDKPPLGDGLPWSTWPDRADGCEIGTVTSAGQSASVEIRYSFAASPEADYADRLVLTHAENGWLLDDIEFADGATLRSSLAEAFAGQPMK